MNPYELLASKTPADLRLMLAYLERNKLETLFPETGPLRRELYRKHLEFFEAGKTRTARAFIAGNRVGKTIAGAYEDALHLTGRYPDWWPGKRFKKATKGWIAGLTNDKVRASLQMELCGQIVRDPTGPKDQVIGLGSGMIPAGSITGHTKKSGVQDAIDTLNVRHVSGRISVLQFKSYEAGVSAFSSEALDFIHLDEEAEQDIYVECCVRTMTRGGVVYLTATPENGMTELMRQMMDALRDQIPFTEPDSKPYVVMAGWDDAPHLTEAAKKDLEAKIPAYQRDSKIRGIPQLGKGAIYPIAETDIKVRPFSIPEHWPRAFGLDVGNNTGCLWFAKDRERDIIYAYREYFRSGDIEAIPPSLHALAIRGNRDEDKWIPGVIDPASRGRSQTDGQNLLQMYRDLGLNLTPADNAVESGIQQVLDALVLGRLKIFETLSRFFEEFRLYQRDKNGKVLKKRDHLMDAMRYFWLSGRDIMRTRPSRLSARPQGSPNYGERGWMG